MIKLNNLYKLLILLIISSCSLTSSRIDGDNIATERISKDSFFKKSSSSLSALKVYETKLLAIESFNISNDLDDYEISHKSLPFPSVAKISNPDALDEYIIVRNVKSTTNSKLEISENLASLLQVNSRIYVEYLKDESLRIRNVEDSKELSKVKLDDVDISFENLDDEQSEISASLDLDKIKEIDVLSKSYEGFIFIGTYNDIGSAKLNTNKIRNLSLKFEESNDKINVFTGPFRKNDINLKIDFLIRNGYSNARKYP